MAEDFSHHCLSFSISVIFKGKWVVKTEGCQRKWPKSHKSVTKTFFFSFLHLLRSCKIGTYVMSYTRYASLVKILLKFELIRAHLVSFHVIQDYSFEFIQGYFEVTQDHFEYIEGLMSSFRFIQAHFDLQLMQTHLDQSKLIQNHQSLFRLIWVRLIQAPLACLNSFEHFYAHLTFNSF